MDDIASCMGDIVQDVEIAEALLEHYVASLGAIDVASPLLTLRYDKRLAHAPPIGSVEQVCLEIARRLQSARSAAAASGRDLTSYGEVSPNVAVGSLTGARAARAAIAIFRAVFADLRWRYPPEKTSRDTPRAFAAVG